MKIRPSCDYGTHVPPPWARRVLVLVLVGLMAACSASDDAALDDPAADGGTGDVEYPVPAERGPHAVGTRRHKWVNAAVDRSVPVRVWYPASAEGDGDARYISLLQGSAHVDAEGLAGPYPVVLFSHGFRGAAEQSFSITEHIASWGYFVAAPDHVTNTLFAFSATDQDAAEVARLRPVDLRYALDRISAPDYELSVQVDASRVAVMGHSFGGWTALIVAGARVHVAEANKRCKAGASSNLFCKYTELLPDDQKVGGDPPWPGLKAAVALAPGGYSSFGDSLSQVSVPTVVFGGTKDTNTSIEVEIDPIYAGLPPPKARVVIENAGHMSFTDICSLDFAKTLLKEFCGTDGIIDGERGNQVTRAFVTAWLDRFVKEREAASNVFTTTQGVALFPEAVVTAKGL